MQQDLLRINALVDGELAPTERAELAARLAVERDLAHTYATLARLKAVVADDADDTPPIYLPLARRRGWGGAAGVAAALAAVIAIALFAASDFLSGGIAEAPNESATAITLASLPAGTTIPQLDTAGLKLVNLDIEPNHVPVFTARYRGPHGCRLDLRAWPVGEPPAPLEGSSHYRWTVGGLSYELVAHGMPVWRFDIIADAAELQTRLHPDHHHINRRLREARNGAPPCAG